MRASSVGRLFPLVSAALLVGGCVDINSADNCLDLGSCPYPDAGVILVQQGPTPCGGQCVPGGAAGWNPPYLVWMGDSGSAPTCKDVVPAAPVDYFHGSTPPPAPVCPSCTCQAPTGSCMFPLTAIASASPCGADAGAGTAFDSPNPWDGTCTSENAIGGGIRSVTIAPLVLNEHGCVSESEASVPSESGPTAPTLAQGCWGQAYGDCVNPGDMCVPATPAGTWTYCISQLSSADGIAMCPQDSAYATLHIFAASYTDAPTCSPCTCDPAEGSACSSVVSLYADSVCSVPVGQVTALLSASMCVDTPAASPLGSKTASPPVYEPGACVASGGTLTGSAIPHEQMTLCCLD